MVDIGSDVYRSAKVDIERMKQLMRERFKGKTSALQLSAGERATWSSTIVVLQTMAALEGSHFVGATDDIPSIEQQLKGQLENLAKATAQWNPITSPVSPT